MLTLLFQTDTRLKRRKLLFRSLFLLLTARSHTSLTHFCAPDVPASCVRSCVQLLDDFLKTLKWGAAQFPTIHRCRKPCSYRDNNPGYLKAISDWRTLWRTLQPDQRESFVREKRSRERREAQRSHNRSHLSLHAFGRKLAFSFQRS